MVIYYIIIDMVDAARYRHYNVDIESTLDFDMSRFKNRLEFAAAFNQLIKRSDYRTLLKLYIIVTYLL
jgi:hypothetical protein